MDSTTAAILAAIITGGLSLIGVILSNRAASSWMQAQLESSRPSPTPSWKSGQMLQV